jgi:hypothetical protein
MRYLASSLVAYALLGAAQIALAQKASGPTYTLEELTSNNTSACSSSTYAPLGAQYCADAFPGTNYSDFFPDGWTDNQYSWLNHEPTPVITVPHNPSPAGVWNVSQGRGAPFQFDPSGAAPGDMHSLLYGTGENASKTKIVMELQSWFCDGVHSETDTCMHSTYTPFSQPPGRHQYIDLYDGHGFVGYTTWWQDTMDARTVNIWDRGADIVAWDWYGGPNNCPPVRSANYDVSVFTLPCPGKFVNADKSYQDMLQSIQSALPTWRPKADMQFFLILDHGAWTVDTACGQAGTKQPWCAASKMIVDLRYARTIYTNQESYLRHPLGDPKAVPVVAFFQDETNDLSQCNHRTCYWGPHRTDTCSTQSDCFMQIYSLVTQELDAQFGKNNYYRIFAYQQGCPDKKNNPGSGHPYSDGCYAWIKVHTYSDPSKIDIPSQLYSDTAQKTLSNFYINAGNLTDVAPNGLPPLVMGAVFKGFDDYQATWWAKSGNKVLTQGCGTTWQNTFAEPRLHGFGPENPLPYIVVETWDDYEEGTEVETGISNCIDSSTFNLTINADLLSWSFGFLPQQGIQFDPRNTIHHYALFASTDGGHTYSTKDNKIGVDFCFYASPTMKCTIDLGEYPWDPGTYKLRIQAVGQASIINNMSHLSEEYVVK